MFKRSFIYLFLACMPCYSFAQVNSIRTLSAGNYNIDSLKILYGEHKEFIPEFELQCLLALSYYPELKDSYISFRYKSIGTTGKTSATTSSFLVNKNRHYIIYINSKAKGRIPLLKDVPFNGQVGLIGHELAHVADFCNRKCLSMAAWAYSYAFKNKKADCEKATDQLTIQHGLGWQLYDWMNFVLNQAVTTEKYKSFKKKNYLLPEEIAQLTEAQKNSSLGRFTKN